MKIEIPGGFVDVNKEEKKKMETVRKTIALDKDVFEKLEKIKADMEFEEGEKQISISRVISDLVNAVWG
jgi:hypothetical protein